MSESLLPPEVHNSVLETEQSKEEKNSQELPEQFLELVAHPGNAKEASFRKNLEKDLGFTLDKLPPRYLTYLLSFLSRQNEAEFKNFCNVIADLPEDLKIKAAKTFFIAAEDPYYRRLAAWVISGFKTGHPRLEPILDAYNGYVDRAFSESEQIVEEYNRQGNLQITKEFVLKSLLSGSRDLFEELAETYNFGGMPEDYEEVIEKFTKISPKDQAARLHLKSIARLLEHGDQVIDFNLLEKEQSVMLHTFKGTKNKAAFFRALHIIRALEPVPEIHWRVDRTSEEYNRRFGLRLNEFLMANAEDAVGKQNFLEIGPGSGVAMRERGFSELSEKYREFGLSDKVYITLTPILEQCINFQKLENAAGKHLNREERNLLLDFLFKILVIAPGQTHKDSFQYSGAARDAFNHGNLNYLKGEIKSLGSRIQDVEMTPSTISSRTNSGEVVYPYKNKVQDQSDAFAKAFRELQQNYISYLVENFNELDLYDTIDAFPANVLIGDMRKIKQFKNNQLDVVVASRSVVYLKGEEYVDFLTELSKKLTSNGMVIDDSIRDNDGWYYRIAEVLQAKKRMADPQLQIWVVMGPGFKDEDARADLVPLSMIIAKQKKLGDLAQQYLEPGCSLVSLEDLAEGKVVDLKTLDVTGLTAKNVQSELEAKAMPLAA